VPADIPGADAVLSRAGRRLTPVRGRAYLSQRAAGRDWRVSAGAFWQVHPGAADALTDAVMTALGPQPGDVALDLYCGAGLFAGVLAPAVGPGGTVAGVEADPIAVRDARHNLRPWPWARVHKGDVAALLRRGGATLPPARLVVADPPRSGLAREVTEYLGAAEHGASRFAYVSCDPATLARDIGLLMARGWALAGLRAFDAFPMTHHVECVATLVRNALADPAVRSARSAVRSARSAVRSARSAVRSATSAIPLSPRRRSVQPGMRSIQPNPAPVLNARMSFLCRPSAMPSGLSRSRGRPPSVA
jgi:hypothetical protein